MLMTIFPIFLILQELNCEFEIAVQKDAERNMKRRLSQSKNSELYSVESFQKRLDTMKEDSAVGNNIKNFQSRLKETVKKAHEAINLKTRIEVAESDGYQDGNSE